MMGATKARSSDSVAVPRLVQECMEAVAPQIAITTWRWQELQGAKRRLADGRLHLTVAGRRVRMAVALRPSLRDVQLGPLAHLRAQVETGEEQLLVCSRRVGEQLGNRLRELGIAYLDTTGSAWFDVPGVVVRLAGRRAVKHVGLRSQLTGNDLRLLHVLMRDAATQDRNHRQLAAAAGIALGAVGKGLRALEARGLLRRRGANRWSLPDLAAAQARFADGWATVVRRRLEPMRCRPLDPLLIEGLPEKLVAVAGGCLLGGELAAARMTGTLQTQCATLHVPGETQAEVASALRLVEDPGGPITLVARFGMGDAFADGQLPGLLLAHPLLVHAELIAIGDERLSTVAAAIWRQLEARGGR